MFVPNPFTHILVGFFLLAAVVSCARYLLDVYGFEKQWLRIPASIFLILFISISAISGMLILTLGPIDALLGIALGAGLCLSLFHPMVAVSFFVSCLLLRPWETFATKEVLGIFPRLLAGVSLLSWIASRFIWRQMSFVWNRWLTLFTLLFGWLLFSALISPYSDENFDYIFKIFLPTYVVCVLLANSLESEKDLELLIQTTTYSITGVLVGAITMTIAHPNFGSSLRLEGGAGINGNSNDLAALAVMASPFAIIAIIRKWKKGSISWMSIACLGILVLGLLMTKSRAAFMALTLSIVIYMFLTTQSVTKLAMRLSMAVPFLLVFVTVAGQRDKADLEGSSDSRFNYIIAGFRMLRDHPVFGVGVNNYPRYYDTYTKSYLETGARTAHSTWMLLLSETGFIGLILFSVLFFNSVSKAWKIRSEHPELFMAVIGYGITMSVLSHCYNLFPYLLIFMIIATHRFHNLRSPTI